MNGRKDDQEKDRWDLMPWRQVGKIVQVLTHGAAKYSPGNWMHVPDARDRYFAAAHRHLHAWEQGERTDSESGLPHLAHAGCCILFLHWLDDNMVKSGPTADKPVVNAHLRKDVGHQ